MWFVGALIGAIIGAGIDTRLGFLGAVCGGVIGWLIGRQRRQAVDDRLRALESRIARLEARLEGLAAGEGVDTVAAFVDQGTASLSETGPQHVQPPPPSPAGETGPAVTQRQATTTVPAREPPTTQPIPAGMMTDGTPSSDLVHLDDRSGQATADRSPSLWERLLGGNLMARAGIVVLFFGIAFLLKYGYQHFQMPLELRLVGVSLVALALLVLGWHLRERGSYGLVLQGGGIGVLFLTIFGAFRLYTLLPAGPAFALLVAVAVLSAVLAILQDARSLAVLGTAGGFLAPVLVSSGSGGHLGLFGYYAVLNGGVLAMAWFRSWRVVNLTGFAFTYGVATAIGTLRYTPEIYPAAQFFLILFFLMYVAIPVLFARRQAGRVARALDTTLVFGVPLVSFALQVGLVRSLPYGSASSALALGAFYLFLARALWTRSGDEMRVLVESFLALGTVFTTLAIPLAFDGHWTSAAWALEGTAIIWMGIRQNRLPARLFGAVLQGLAGFYYLGSLDQGSAIWPLLNNVYLGALLLALGGLLSAYLLQQRAPALRIAEQWVARTLFVWGTAWWFFAGLHEIDRHVQSILQGNAMLAYFAASCLAFSVLERRLRWPPARYPALALLPLMGVIAVLTIFHDEHPFAHLGYLAWPSSFAAQWWLLRQHEAMGERWCVWQHAAGLWLLTALGAWEFAWAIDFWVEGRAAWPLIAWALVPGMLLSLLALHGERLRWPVARHLEAYFVLGALPLAVFLAGWFVLGNFVSDGDPWPLPYVPFLNPLDLAQGGSVLAIVTWWLEIRRRRLMLPVTLSEPAVWGIIGVAAFLWANAVLLRTLHHWAGVPLHFADLFFSALVQSALSLLWTLLSLTLMVWAARRKTRVLWLAGAGLLAVVVGKLFFIDLSNVGTIARIVSFLGVGVLMLVVGYLAPVPPKEAGVNGQ